MKKPTKPVSELKPRSQDEVSIVLSCDENYARYAAVTIQSIIDCTFLSTYTVYILGENLDDQTKHKLLQMATHRVHIEYLDMRQYMQAYPKELFYIHSHFSTAIYYRLFVPHIFKHFQKVIYCDCDAVFVTDPGQLYQINLEEKLLAAVRDTGIAYEIYKGATYCSQTLRLVNPLNYFQSGLLVFHIPQMQKYHFTEKCLEVLKKLRVPKWPDQDVMNVVCEGETVFLDPAWNVLVSILRWYPDFEQIVPEKVSRVYEHVLQSPKYIHFGGTEKPWQNISMPRASVWWQYARKTPFYEEILVKYLHLLDQRKRNYSYLRRNYSRCRILANLTWGKTRTHYLAKKQELLLQIKHIESVL